MGMKCKSRCGKFFVLGVLGVVVLGGVLMLLWNWLVPVLFAGQTINYWQALGLLVLSKILFSGFRCHGKHGCHGGGHGSCGDSRLENMTPEERETFKAGMRCCFGKKKSGPESSESGQ